jgi:methanogenic corrinoid protein MtbC1
MAIEGPGRPGASAGAAAFSRNDVTALTYRSLATAPIEEGEMRGLLARAKARNRDLGVTGLLLVSDSQYFQWLEGPSEGVARVWEAIQRDPRHRDIQVINQADGCPRLFGDWDMKFASRDQGLRALRDREDSSAELPSPLVGLVARLAVEGDVQAIENGLEELIQMGYDRLGLHAALLEPATRRLGDWWRDDQVAARDITLGLCNLQAAVRRVSPACPPNGEHHGGRRDILIASPPGEPHILGVPLVSDVFRHAGWRATVEFPATAGALCDVVRSGWFDALGLSLSDAFERLERLPALTELIKAARRASLNPDLVVVCGGRLFRSRPELVERAGADGAYQGAAEAVALTLRHVQSAGQRRARGGSSTVH